MNIKESYDDDTQKQFSEEIQYAEDHGWCLADCDGLIDLERLIGHKIPFAEYTNISKDLWSVDIDTVGIDVENLSEEDYKLIVRVLRKYGIKWTNRN